MLDRYLAEVQENDITNREGHSAKVYFNGLFGKSFSRDYDSPTNAYLNYGYSIILSALNREIVNAGYLTQLGIHHKNEFNQFNLTCDLMEPFRPIVDDFIISSDITEENFKEKLIDILSIKVRFKESMYIMDNFFSKYVLSAIYAIEKNDPSLIKFVEQYEF